jgi:cytidine deaminase
MGRDRDRRAAALTESGEVTTGANVENASCGLTGCAERVAVFRAVAAGHRAIRAVAVYTPTARATPPCGACRQVIFEFGSDALVVSAGSSGHETRHRMSELLPDAFGPRNV